MGKPNSRKAALKRKAVVVPTEPKTVSATALLKKLRPSSDGEEKEEHPEPVKEPVSVDQPEPVIPIQPKTVSAIDLLKKLRPSTEEEEEKPAEPEEECPLAEDFCLSDLVTDPVWKEALQEEFSAPYFLELQKQLAKDYAAGKQIFPERQFIFHAFNSTPLDKIKVVILGQDPYHDDGQAHGLSFSVPRGVKPPPSLKNIYKELSVDIPWFQPPHHGCLQTWADGGIMLLNATLTVLAHKPNSHSKYGWQTFTDSVIRLISRKCQGVVFILWGLFAQKKECLINLSKHSIIKAAHPSPLSVKKFLGCKCFSQANAALVKAGRSPVDWVL